MKRPIDPERADVIRGKKERIQTLLTEIERKRAEQAATTEKTEAKASIANSGRKHV